MSVFLVRLVPPRADFAQTMTDDERHTMDLHTTYWKQLRDGGHVVVYGPVADPEGVWRLGVLRCGDRAEALALSEADPSVEAGLNAVEVAEIIGAVTG